MKYGFVKVSAVTPEVRVADCSFNACEIIKNIKKTEDAKVIVFPELAVTGYTCGDLFFQETLIRDAELAVLRIAEESKNVDSLIIVGAPVSVCHKLYNAAVILYRGKILAIVPKMHLPTYAEFYDARYFAPGNARTEFISWGNDTVPFGTNIIVRDKNMKNFALAIEICEDIWTVSPPSNMHAAAGATIIANLSASSESAGKSKYRKNLVSMQSSSLMCGYIYSSSGTGESTADVVYSGDSMICEKGTLLARGTLFKDEIVTSEIDVDMLAYERRRTSTFVRFTEKDYHIVETDFEMAETNLTRKVEKLPFVQKDNEYFEAVLQLQANGLKKRLLHTGAKKVVVGISGGLDSTLALLVVARAFDMAGLDRKGILAITMPCFGTTERTYNNAVALSNIIGAELREISIKDAVVQHFKDIGQNENDFDITYENSQARERTQVLMDIANKIGALVIGTGDMSELALGWATYNGDHMSMYGVNSGVPKTLIKYLVGYEAERIESQELKAVLDDIVATPVSPELLPPKEGEIAQKTEQVVGPYELHDFFLYNMIRFGFSPKKVYHLAQKGFAGDYSNEEILKWMKMFYRRFFTQQFKRSCVPDGPKAVDVSLSPNDWRMPSDASGKVWLDEIEALV